MISRVLKNEIRSLMRKVADDSATRKVICEFFHHFLNDPNKNFWSTQNKFDFNMKKVILRTFPFGLTDAEMLDSFDLKQCKFIHFPSSLPPAGSNHSWIPNIPWD